MKQLCELFLAFFKIGAFTIGGGYAMLPMIQKEVERKGWVSEEEFLDAISLTNSLPGPLATNTAAFVGYRTAGVPGSAAAVLGVMSPSVLIILAVAAVFHDLMAYPIVGHIFNGIRPAVVALIVYAVIKLARTAKLKEYGNWAVALIGFGAVAFGKVHPILVVLCAALYGLFLRGYVVRAMDRRGKGGGEN